MNLSRSWPLISMSIPDQALQKVHNITLSSLIGPVDVDTGFSRNRIKCSLSTARDQRCQDGRSSQAKRHQDAWAHVYRGQAAVKRHKDLPGSRKDVSCCSGVANHSVLKPYPKVRVQSYVGRGKAVIVRNGWAKVGHLESQQKVTLFGNYAQEQSGAYREDDSVRWKIIESPGASKASGQWTTVILWDNALLKGPAEGFCIQEYRSPTSTKGVGTHLRRQFADNTQA